MTTLAPTILRLKNHIGSSVELRGWVVQKRSSGKIGFIQVRDGSGVVQAVASRADISEVAWSDVERGDWPAGYPADKRPQYSLAEIRGWLKVFVQRFYSFSQFKRSAMPNGPKVSAGGSLSPRGDWRAPSDMSARIWLEEIQREIPEG